MAVDLRLLAKLPALGCLWRAGGLFGIALCQGSGSHGLIRASGERALVSSCSIILLTCVGSLVILHVVGHRMYERFVGVACRWCFFSFELVFMMDLRASLGFLMDIRRSAEPYLM